MVATTMLGGLNQEMTQRELIDTLVYLVSQLLNQAPRLDAADRMLVSLAEVNPTVNIAGGQTVATVTALNTMGVSARPIDYIPSQIANAGCMHIYDNIQVS